MPLPGIYASSMQGIVEPPSAYDALASVTVGTAVSSITFAGIPAGYQHLQLRVTARAGITNPGNDGGFLFLRFNNDSSNYYATHQISGNGSTAAANAFTPVDGIYYQRFPGVNAGANIFGASVLDILDYQNTSKNKTLRNLAGFDNNGGGQIYFTSGLWPNTSAINSITLTAEGSTNFAQYSQFALYGVK